MPYWSNRSERWEQQRHREEKLDFRKHSFKYVLFVVNSRSHRPYAQVSENVECAEAETSRIPRARNTRGHSRSRERRARCYFKRFSFFLGISISKRQQIPGMGPMPVLWGSAATATEPGPPLSSIPQPCDRAGQFVIFQRAWCLARLRLAPPLCSFGALSVSAGESYGCGDWPGSY